MPEALPVQPSIANYTVGVVLENRAYVIGMRWNSYDNAWYLDVMDEDEDPIRMGIKVVLDDALGRDCTDPRFPPGLLTASDTSNADREAGYDDMGTRVGLFYYTAEEYLALVEEALG